MPETAQAEPICRMCNRPTHRKLYTTDTYLCRNESCPLSNVEQEPYGASIRTTPAAAAVLEGSNGAYAYVVLEPDTDSWIILTAPAALGGYTDFAAACQQAIDWIKQQPD